MSILLKIYFFCVIGACIYVALLTWVAKPFLNEDESYDKAYTLWDNAPLLHKIGAVVIPLVNLVFAFMTFVLVYIKIRWLWYDLGRFVVRRFTKSKDLKHFRIKEFIVRTFFRFYIDLFYKRFENDTLDKMLKKLHDRETKK